MPALVASLILGHAKALRPRHPPAMVARAVLFFGYGLQVTGYQDYRLTGIQGTYTAMCADVPRSHSAFRTLIQIDLTSALPHCFLLASQSLMPYSVNPGGF